MQHMYIYIYTYIYIYIYIYMPVKVNVWMSLKQSTFYEVENSTPLLGLERTISITYQVPLIFVMSKQSSKQCISNIFLHISCFKPRNRMRKLQKYELRMSDDNHFEFYDLWGNGAIYSLAYSRNGFSTKKSYRINKWSTFPQKCLQVLYLGLYFDFLYWLCSWRRFIT